MGFTVPNRPDTGIDADQAEPDKGDFQTLGYQKSGVLSGGATTRSAANTVTVAGPVEGYLNGEWFSISGADLATVAPAAGNAKFDLICVYKSGGGVFGLDSLIGTTGNNGESASNAMYPDGEQGMDYTARMLLAAVYYAVNDTDINADSIVDKRVFILPQANPKAVSASPGAAEGAVGEIRVDSSLTAASGRSNVWVKTATATWTEIASYVPSVTPSDGTAATIVIGNVTDLPYGDAPTVSNTNTPTAAVLDFGIPAGRPGENAVSLDGTYLRLDTGGEDGQVITGSMFTNHIFPVNSSANVQIGSIYMTYKKIVLTDNPVVMSDLALKERFDESPGLSFVEALTPQSYVLKNDPKKVHWGFVAQDVEDVCTQHGVSEAAVYEKPEEGRSGGYMALTYGEFTAPIVKAIQELTERLEALENG